MPCSLKLRLKAYYYSHLVSMLVSFLSVVRFSMYTTTKDNEVRGRETGEIEERGIVDVPECRRADRTSEA
jgi:hypothetical protein